MKKEYDKIANLILEVRKQAPPIVKGGLGLNDAHFMRVLIQETWECITKTEVKKKLQALSHERPRVIEWALSQSEERLAFLLWLATASQREKTSPT